MLKEIIRRRRKSCRMRTLDSWNKGRFLLQRQFNTKRSSLHHPGWKNNDKKESSLKAVCTPFCHKKSVYCECECERAVKYARKYVQNDGLKQTNDGGSGLGEITQLCWKDNEGFGLVKSTHSPSWKKKSHMACREINRREFWVWLLIPISHEGQKWWISQPNNAVKKICSEEGTRPQKIRV